MPIDDQKLRERKKAALAAIHDSYGTEDGEYGATLFVTHHFEELDSSYWVEQFGTATPEPARVLASLVLRSEFEEGEVMDSLDFTLPAEGTTYVLCVSFGDDGRVGEISMEG